jgi:hypothetical protein
LKPLTSSLDHGILGILSSIPQPEKEEYALDFYAGVFDELL